MRSTQFIGLPSCFGKLCLVLGYQYDGAKEHDRANISTKENSEDVAPLHFLEFSKWKMCTGASERIKDKSYQGQESGPNS
jgi:hypothetical protein